MHASKLFVRFNGVYKQASIERQAVKRKDLVKDYPANGNIFSASPLIQDHETIVTIM